MVETCKHKLFINSNLFRACIYSLKGIRIVALRSGDMMQITILRMQDVSHRCWFLCVCFLCVYMYTLYICVCIHKFMYFNVFPNKDGRISTPGCKCEQIFSSLCALLLIFYPAGSSKTHLKAEHAYRKYALSTEGYVLSWVTYPASWQTEPK